MKKVVLFFVMCVTALAASAQSDDFGIWTSLEIQKKIDKKWSVSVEGENRMQDNLNSVDRWTIGVSGAYKPLKWLKIDVGYKFIRYKNLEETKAKVTKYADEAETEIENIKIRTSEPYWNSRHRVFVSLTLQKKFGNIEMSLREQWQYNHRLSTTTTRKGTKYMLDDWDEETISIETDSVSSKNSHLLRSRLQAQYDKKGVAWKPFASIEMYNGGSRFDIQKMRYTVGLEYKITKQHSVEAYYRYQRKSSSDHGENLFAIVQNTTNSSGSPVFQLPSANYDETLFGNNDRSCHIVGVGYKFKF